MNTTRKTLSRNYRKNWQARVLHFGRYKGKTLLWIAENRPNYLLCIAVSDENDEEFQAKVEAAIDYMLEQRPTP